MVLTMVQYSGQITADKEDLRMATIDVTPLFSIEMQFGSANQIGALAQGARAIGDVKGRFEGPGIKGTIEARDWYLARNDGIGEPDVRGILRTDDGAVIYMRYTGVLDMRRMEIPAGSATPVKGTCQVRTAIRFETSADRYRELNNVQAVGIGQVTFETGAIRYEVYGL
jgi:Protein of unknown function (DUF3237)